MKGAMLTFGGHKGSALAAMVELLAGPLIGDLTSADSKAFDEGANATPCHGELIVAFNPALFAGTDRAEHDKRAEALFDSIVSQGARLPSQRRFDARLRSEASGAHVPRELYDDVLALIPK
jgi:LDH2 family malate/lactate/ureidoglycolate dehydrogenase